MLFHKRSNTEEYVVIEHRDKKGYKTDLNDLVGYIYLRNAFLV